MKDDIAYNEDNPNPGEIRNSPDGPNVYVGVPKDYTNDNLNGTYFLDVLGGKKMDVGSGKTLNTGPKDRIFVYFADHGDSGFSYFGDGILKATDLLDTLNMMHTNKKYNEMVIYWESCFSGSMFQNLSTNINVYALSAANSTQSSYACYCTDVNCYGDCFSVSWMEDADNEKLNNETLLIQFWITRQETLVQTRKDWISQHVKQWGSIAKMNHEKISRYLESDEKELGFKTKPPISINHNSLRGIAIPQPEVALHVLMMKYKNAITFSERWDSAANLYLLKYKRKLLQTKIDEIIRSTVETSLEAGRLNDKQKRIVATKDPNTVLDRTQYETCYYPLVEKFQDRCFSFKCNDYVPYQMKMFLPLCKADIEIGMIEDAIDKNCNHEKSFCGIH